MALRSPSGSVTTTWVSLRSSLAGSSRAPGAQRAHSASVTCEGGYPARSIWLRHQMGGQITVAETEPVGLHPVGRQFLLGMPRFVTVTPATFRVDTTAEGVHAGVEVRTDPHAEHPGVVSHIDDGGQLMLSGRFGFGARSGKLPELRQVLDAEEEAGAAHAADENCDLHALRP